MTNHAESNQRIKVKFLAKAISGKAYEHWLARFPKGIPSWGNCDFIFDRDCAAYDWLVVYDDLPSRSGERRTLWEEALTCARARTLLITTEPSSIKVYDSRYTRQFGWVLTSQEPWAIRHPKIIHSQPGLVWYYGATGHGNVAISARGSYDAVARHIPLEKSRCISTVCSSKKQRHTLHQARNRFVERLQTVLPELEVFGHGVRYAEDKADTLDPYRYHIAIENHVCTHHWTEKLGDTFLGGCLPLYHGCRNYADYFPAESVIPINVHAFDESLETIQRAIRDGEYEKRQKAILESRRLYLERYWTFAHLARVISERHATISQQAVAGDTICSRHLLRKRSMINGLSSAYAKTRVSLRHRLTSLFAGPSGRRNS